MAIFCDKNVLLKNIYDSFIFCTDNKINKRIFTTNCNDSELDICESDFENLKLQYEPINQSSLNRNQVVQNIESSEKRKKFPIIQKVVSWKESNERDIEYINSLIIPYNNNNQTELNQDKSILSDLIFQDIKKRCSFSIYSTLGFLGDTSKKNYNFNIAVTFDNKNPREIIKQITLKENATVGQLIGFVLFLCQSQDFKLNINPQLESYRIYCDDQHLDPNLPPLLTEMTVNEIQSTNLHIKYELTDLMANVIFHSKTPTSSHTSKDYCLNLNRNFRSVLVQYLQSRNLKSDGGYDVYLKKNKIYIRDLGVSMLNFKDEVDENNQLEIEIIYYDPSNIVDFKQHTQAPESTDHYRHLSLILTLSSIEVNLTFEVKYIEITPVTLSKSLFAKFKNIIINFSDIKECIVKQSKHANKKQLKIKYIDDNSKKNILLESSYYEIEEINKKINDILYNNKQKLKD